MKPPPPKELKLHIAVADRLKADASPDWRWTHFPAGEEPDKRHAAKLKAMGLQRGWPDFILVSPGGRLHALELKRQGETLSEDQEAFAEWCGEQGVPFACHDDLLGAIGTLSSWGVVRVRLASP
jgi:VRR-NUC domain